MNTTTERQEMTNSSEELLPSPFGCVSNDSLRSVTFVFGIILIPAFSIFGCFGNVLSMVVLVHHKMRNSTNSCLAALAVSDFLLLLHSLLFASINIISSFDPFRGENLRNAVYPLFGAYGSIVTARITSLLTTMLSVERFIAVYVPIKAKQLCAKRHADFGIVFIYITTVLLFIPFALKYHAVYEVMGVSNITVIKLHKTAFGQNKQFYRVYGNILNVLLRVLPLVLIVVLNTLIAIAIRKTWSTRRQLSETCTQSGVYEQNRITLMLLAVSCVFVVCILPGICSSFASKIWPEYSRSGKEKNLFFCISSVAYFLETVNSSINFIIYMALSQKFWRTYKEIFCFRRTFKGNNRYQPGRQYAQALSKGNKSPTSSTRSTIDTKLTRVSNRTSVCSNSSVVKYGHPKHVINVKSISRKSTDRNTLEPLSMGRELMSLHRDNVHGDQPRRHSSGFEVSLQNDKRQRFD